MTDNQYNVGRKRNSIGFPTQTAPRSDATKQLRNEKGTYILVLRLAENTVIARVGRSERFRNIFLQAGFYVYVGSAHGAGGTKARVSHHLRNNASRPVWHLDSIRPAMAVEAVWVTYDSLKRECQWSTMLHRDLGGHVPVPGLGSTECSRCPTHFYRFESCPAFSAFAEAIDKCSHGHAPVQRIRLAEAMTNDVINRKNGVSDEERAGDSVCR